MATKIVDGVEVGPDGKTEWAKIEAGYAHVDHVLPLAIHSPFLIGPAWYGHVVREAFVAGAEWQERRQKDGD